MFQHGNTLIHFFFGSERRKEGNTLRHFWNTLLNTSDRCIKAHCLTILLTTSLMEEWDLVEVRDSKRFLLICEPLIFNTVKPETVLLEVKDSDRYIAVKLWNCSNSTFPHLKVLISHSKFQALLLSMNSPSYSQNQLCLLQTH